MSQTYLVVELSHYQLHIYQDGHCHASYPVAIGTSKTPTPMGNWYIVNKKILTESGPFGSRWLGLNQPGYGIHGTNAPSAIGTAVSMGCIRMHNADVQQLFDRVDIDTPVLIVP